MNEGTKVVDCNQKCMILDQYQGPGAGWNFNLGPIGGSYGGDVSHYGSANVEDGNYREFGWAPIGKSVRAGLSF